MRRHGGHGDVGGPPVRKPSDRKTLDPKPLNRKSLDRKSLDRKSLDRKSLDRKPPDRRWPRGFVPAARAGRIPEVCEAALYRAIRRGDIPAVKVHGHWFVSARALERIFGLGRYVEEQLDHERDGEEHLDEEQSQGEQRGAEHRFGGAGPDEDGAA